MFSIFPGVKKMLDLRGLSIRHSEPCLVFHLHQEDRDAQTKQQPIVKTASRRITMIRKAAVLRRQMALARVATRTSGVIAATSGAGMLLIGIAAATFQDEDESGPEEHLSGKRRGISRSKFDDEYRQTKLTNLRRAPATHLLELGCSKRRCQCEANTASSAAVSRKASPAETQDLTRRMTLRRMNSAATENTVESLYDIDPEPLGVGAFGEVYYAKDRRTGRGVAVKRISKEYTDELEFQREMNALLHIRACGGHPNICQLRENFEEARDFILVLDLIEGGEMFQYLIDNGAYSEWEAARLIREVASALAFLHGVGLVHADLKPENLMLTSKNKDEASVKLVDFGCAEIVPEYWGDGPPLDGGDGSDEETIQLALMQPTRMIRPGRAGGTTSAYCPPESFDSDEGSPISPSMDCWSLGVILYIMLVGLHPFDINSNLTDEEIEVHIKEQRTPPLHGSPHTAHLSPSAIDLLSKLMSDDPRKRLSAHEMLDHPWVKGETARRDVIEGLDEKLSKLRRFQSKVEAKVFHNLISWSDDDQRRDPSQKGKSLLEKAFSSLDESGKGFVTMDDVARYVGATVTDHEGNVESAVTATADDTSKSDSINLSGFSDLVGEHMQSKYFPRGHVVFHEGDPGQHMWFINSGTVEVSTKDGFRAKLGQGDSFGEGSLLRPGATRSATLRCATPVHVIQVDKEYFSKYLSSGDTKMALRLREKINTRSFGRVEFILSEQPGLERVDFEQGDILFNIGDEADEFFILDEGKVDVRGPKGNIIYEMSAGDVFGLQSLVMDRSRKASATCSSKDGCKCRRLDYHRFNQLLHQSPELKKALHDMCYRREFKRAVVLRSRKSFPVQDQLRQAFDDLDKDNSGVLSVDEVRDLLTHLDKNLTEDQQKVLIESMDHTGSGNITFDEFQSVFGKL